MNNDRIWQFWLTLGGIFNFICFLTFIGYCVFSEQLIIRKEHCLFLLPALIYFLLQFAVNYANLIDDKNDESKKYNKYLQ